MADLPAVIASGIVSGSAYALLALGIVIIFRSTDTVNFAIGDIGTLAVFVTSTLIAAGLPVGVGLLVAIVVAGLCGVATERLLIRPLGHGRNLLFVALVITIGLGLLIHAGIYAGWGTRPRPFPVWIPGSISVFGISLAWNKIAATAIVNARLDGQRKENERVQRQVLMAVDVQRRMLPAGSSRFTNPLPPLRGRGHRASRWPPWQRF